MAQRDQRATSWQTVIYETSDGRRPAVEYLMSSKTPATVRRELLVTVAAVTEMGPPRFPTSTPRWRLMHKAQEEGGD